MDNEEDRFYAPPATKTLALAAAGYRLFTDTDVDTLAFIRRAGTLGLRLNDIADILAIRQGGAASCTTVNDLIGACTAEVDQAIADLRHSPSRLGRHPQWAQLSACTTSSTCAIVESQAKHTAGGASGDRRSHPGLSK